MSAKIIFMGRPTENPVMKQSQNGGSEYVSLNIGTSQRGQDGKDESIFYQCYFSKFLAERLIKAGVQKGTCLLITGTLEIQPFIYQKGNRAGQPGVNANVRVLDWDFAIANRDDTTGQNGGNPNPGNANGVNQGNGAPGGYAPNGFNNPAGNANMQNAGAPNAGYPNVPAAGYTPPAGMPNGQNVGYQGGFNGYQASVPNGFQNVPQEQLPYN